jgi:hypothetical protein
MNSWIAAIIGYVSLALTSFIPVLAAMLKQVKLKPGGDSFKESPHFTSETITLLEQHYTRLQGTLLFWKNQAEWNRRFHYYTLFWTIPVSILIPIISQALDTSATSKLFLTIISSHIAVLYGFHRALKIENNYKAFRYGESEFYDLYRRLLDRPKTFGKTEKEQVDNYFVEVEKIRKNTRISETDNFPIVEDPKSKNVQN